MYKTTVQYRKVKIKHLVTKYYRTLSKKHNLRNCPSSQLPESYHPSLSPRLLVFIHQMVEYLVYLGFFDCQEP